MERKSIIPLPPSKEEITDRSLEFLNEWISYFESLSPRVKIILNSDPKFNLEFLKSKVVEFINEGKVKLLDWPEENQVAFIVALDSSLPKEKQAYFIKDIYVFCYGNVAFSVNHLSRDDFDEESMMSTFSLSDYSSDLLEWKFILSLIKRYLENFSKSVPIPP